MDNFLIIEGEDLVKFAMIFGNDTITFTVEEVMNNLLPFLDSLVKETKIS